MLNFANGNVVDWASIVRGLKMCGWSQQAVAEALGCSQGAISQLNTGRHADPAYSLGVRLLALHDRVRTTVTEAREPLQRDVCPRPLRRGAQHVPGDTNTLPAPDAVWIGSGDA